MSVTALILLSPRLSACACPNVPSKRDQEWWAESAAGAARNPVGWLHSAEQLRRAADAVLEHVRRDWQSLPRAFANALAGEQRPPSVAGQYMMLAGFAIENLAKGLILVSEPRRVQPDPAKPGRLLRWEGSGHLLERLLRDANVTLSGAESELVARLETFINWAGRYPVALQAMEMAHPPGEDGRARMSSDDIAVLEALYERLQRRLWHEAIEAGQQAQVLDTESRARRRVALLDELAELERETTNGVTTLLRRGQPGQPASAVGCATCGAGLTLSPDKPAAFCRCGFLHHCEVRYDASLGRDMPNVESYPPLAWPPWYSLNSQSRFNITSLSKAAIPPDPGVYALYRNAQAVYVGKAKSLRQRVWTNHCGKGKSMTSSAFRRNVAEHLGIASASAIKTGAYRPTPDDLRRVREWTEACDVAWVVCASEAAADALERSMKRQWKPPLTKR